MLYSLFYSVAILNREFNFGEKTMKNAFAFLMSWFLSDPRRLFTIVFVIVMVLTLTLAVAPGGVAFAEDITSGS